MDKAVALLSKAVEGISVKITVNQNGITILINR